MGRNKRKAVQSIARKPPLRRPADVPESQWQSMFASIDAGESLRTVALRERLNHSTLGLKYAAQ